MGDGKNLFLGYRVSCHSMNSICELQLMYCYLFFRLCEGGELFYHITKKKHLSEA